MQIGICKHTHHTDHKLDTDVQVPKEHRAHLDRRKTRQAAQTVTTELSALVVSSVTLRAIAAIPLICFTSTERQMMS